MTAAEQAAARAVALARVLRTYDASRGPIGPMLRKQVRREVNRVRRAAEPLALSVFFADMRASKEID